MHAPPLPPEPRATRAAWWVDGHLDLAYIHLAGRDITRPIETPAAHAVSLPALRAADVRVVLGTIFTELKPDAGAAWEYAHHGDAERAHDAGVRQLAYYEDLECAGHIRIVRTAADLRAAALGGPTGVVLLMECADPIRTPDEAAWWHARGVRVVGLSWSHGSRYAGGNATSGGLTAAGRAIVAEFDRLGILHDASHLSDAAFTDLCAATRACIVATHSNARSLAAPIERHLRDDHYAIIAARGGMVGLNLYGRFLATGRTATLDDALNHICHAAARVGRDRVGLGSDFDGGFTPAECPLGCQRPQELGALLEGLVQRGWTPAECDGFAHGNWVRTLHAALCGAAPRASTS